MATETEARFASSGPEPLAALTEVDRLGPGALGPPSAFDEVDVYLDTASGDIAARGWACRLRARGGRWILSLKGPPPAAADGWLHRRPELEGPATDAVDPAAWPRSAARDLLDELAGGAQLAERFVLRQHRVERTVAVETGPVGTLTLDTVDVEHRGIARGRLHVVELELGADVDERVLEPLAEALALRPGLAPEPRTKLEHALELIGAP